MRFIAGLSHLSKLRGLKGDLIFEDVHMHVQPGTFVLDGVKVQSSTLEKVEKTVEQVICTALDPCNLVCKKVFNTIVQWVQLDQLAHASGDFTPYIEGGNFRVHAEHIDVDLSLPVKMLIFAAADALLPLGGFVSVVLMIVGKIFADRAVTGFVDNTNNTGVIDRPIPGTQMHFRASATQVDWPEGAWRSTATSKWRKPNVGQGKVARDSGGKPVAGI